MDRTTVRIILLIIGVAVIAGIYAWHRYGEQIRLWLSGLASRRKAAIPGFRRSAAKNPAEATERFDDYFDDYELSPARSRDAYSAEERPAAPAQPQPATGKSLPSVIQLSVVAVENAYFTGGELLDAFEHVGLQYGEMGIFHWLDRDGETVFSVASLLEPGTFPIDDMMTFAAPGIVLFFQPDHVADPQEAFDSLVSCCHELAIRLNGVEWDAARQPLTTEKILALRASLA